jgi:hypothetical protein
VDDGGKLGYTAGGVWTWVGVTPQNFKFWNVTKIH